MGKYIVSDAELNLLIAKNRQRILNKRLEIACEKLDKAEENYYIQSEEFLNQSKLVHSLVAKLSWAKRKNK